MLASSFVSIGTGQQPLPRITGLSVPGTRVSITDSDGRLEPLTAVVAGEAMTWTEQRLVGRAYQLVHAAGAAARSAGHGSRAQ